MFCGYRSVNLGKYWLGLQLIRLGWLRVKQCRMSEIRLGSFS